MIFFIIQFTRFISSPSVIYYPDVLPRNKNLSLFIPYYQKDIRTDVSFGSNRDSIYLYSFNNYSIMTWSIQNYCTTPLNRISINRKTGFTKEKEEIYGRIDLANLSIFTNGKSSKLDSLIINFDTHQELQGIIRDSNLLYQNVYFKNIEIKGTLSKGQILISSKKEVSKAQFALYKRKNKLFILMLWDKDKDIIDNDLLLKMIGYK